MEIRVASFFGLTEIAQLPVHQARLSRTGRSGSRCPGAPWCWCSPSAEATGTLTRSNQRAGEPQKRLDFS